MREYKRLRCIEKMSDSHKEIFDNLVEEYGKKLSSRIVNEDAVYTLHDFEHHCFDIYKIVSNVLLDEKLAYKSEDYGLTSRVLLILNVAILFHDIGMSHVLGATRENHAKKSAQYVQDEYDKNSILRQKGDFFPDAIKAIIVAHSDDKTEFAVEEENGLKSSKLRRQYYTTEDEEIPTLFLAGILRIADELDISSARLGGTDLEIQLKDGIQAYEKNTSHKDLNDDAIAQWENYKKSLKHWERLHLVSSVRKGEDGETIDIVLDDDQIERFLDEGKTEESIGQDIADIYMEIEKKLKEAVQLSFSGERYGKLVFVKKLHIITQNEKLEREIQNKLSIKSLSPRIDNKGFEKKSNSNEAISKPQVIDSDLELRLLQEVKKRDLISFGHFIINEKYCARDWIDVRELIETKDILNKIVQSIVRDINSKSHNEYVIIGVDLNGALLASRIAFSLQSPLSYVVSEKEEKNNADKEIELNIDSSTKIILITDAIVTYETIERVINKYSLEDRIDSIYTVFYRENEFVNCNSKYADKTFSLNNKLPIELYKKEKCVYRKEGCIAKNRKLRKD